MPGRASGSSAGKNPPAFEVRLGGVRVAVWANDANGKTVFNATPSRSYRDDSGHWQTTNTYNAYELLALAEAAREASMRIFAQQAEAARERREQEGDLSFPGDVK